MSLTRRDFLTATLGSAVALEACRKRRDPTFGGAIRGGADELGHRLREGFLVQPTTFRKTSVAIVGGGVSGLCAAWKLSRCGLEDYVVLEAEDLIGGTSCWEKNRVSAFPWAAHYVPVPSPRNRALVELLTEVGAIVDRGEDGSLVFAEEQLVREPEERLFYKGEWYPGLYLRAGASAEDLAQLDRFLALMDRYAAAKDTKGRRAFDIPVALCSNDAEFTGLDRSSFGEWLRQQGFTSPRLLWLANYACRDDYGTTLETTSAWAGVFYYASRVGSPGLGSAELLSWPEGNGRLVEHLSKVAGARARTGVLVTDVVPTDGGVEVHAWDERNQAAVGWQADQVIFAAPRFLARFLIRPFRDQPPPHLAEFTYSPWLVANLTLRSRPASRGFPPAWDNVLYESPSLGYVVATHQALVDHGPTMWTWYHALCGDQPSRQRSKLLAGSWNDWTDVVLADLERAHVNLAPTIESIDVWRWGHAMVRPTPGFLYSSALRKAAEPYRGVFFANTDLSGLALFEEAQYWGVRAAEAVLATRRMSFQTSL